MAYYNGKKVLSAVKVAPILNINEGADVENNALVIDDGSYQERTLKGIVYNRMFVFQYESAIPFGYYLLPSGERTNTEPSTYPYLYIENVGNGARGYLYLNNQTSIALTNQNKGVLTLSDITYIKNAYVFLEIGQDGQNFINCVLFYNLTSD